MSDTNKHKAKGKFNNGLLEEPNETYERMSERHNKETGKFRAIKKNKIEKILDKEMKEEIRVVETKENIDYDIPEQEKILEQIMGRS